jgi:hypothetical protein
MWDNYYGPMSPGFVLGNLEELSKKIVTTDAPIPPEFERELTGLRKLKQRVEALNNAHDDGREWKP